MFFFCVCFFFLFSFPSSDASKFQFEKQQQQQQQQKTFNIVYLNPGPAEIGYTLPLQQCRSQLIWISTVCHSVCEFVSTI